MGSLINGQTAEASPSARLIYAKAPGAQGCGTEGQLRQAVARRLGYDPFVGVSETTLVVEFRHDNGGMRSRLVLIEAGHVLGNARELTSSSGDCDELFLATALAISIAIDPESIEREVDEGAVKPAPREVTPLPSPFVVSHPLSSVGISTGRVVPWSHRVPWLLQVGVGGELSTGPVPWPASGVTFDFEIRRRAWSFGLEPRAYFAAHTEEQAGSSARARMSLLDVAGVPCYHLSALRMCLLSEVGRLLSRGDFALGKVNRTLWAAEGVRMAYEFGLPYGFRLSARLDGLYALNQLSVVLNGHSVYRTPAVIGRTGFSVNYAF